MVGWHHRLNGREFEQTQGEGEEQGNLMCCSLWGQKELDMTEWLDNKNHGMYNTKSDPDERWVVIMCQYRSISCKDCSSAVGDVNREVDRGT